MKNAWFEWGLGAAAAALLGTGLAIVSVTSHPTATAAPGLKADPRVVLASVTSADQFETASREAKHLSVERNETLSGLLDRLGAPRDQANGAVVAAGQLVDLRTMRPGDDVTAWLETDSAAGGVRLMGLSLRPNAERQVLVQRDLDGSWTAHDLKAKLTDGINYVEGDVNQSIYETAIAGGAGDQQVVDYADIFGYDVDFQREVHPGDHFGILYETFDDERGDPVKTGHVLMAMLDGDAISKTFYRFTPSDDSVVDYFDETGQSAKKFLMKTPINGARISSSFGNRMHPILGYTKFHKGTDFAAPTGTPIYAAGNGVLARYGKFSDYGNYALVRHANGYETAYGHMSRFVAGLKVGAHVRQGEIIGYVGMTGGATGPHLHYEVHINGQPINAVTLKLPTGRKLEGVQLAAFKLERQRIDGLRDQEIAERQRIALAKPDPSGAFKVPVAASPAPDTREAGLRP